MKNIDSLKALIAECVRKELCENLNEGIRMSETIVICGGKEVPFGSPEHVRDLQRTLDGLEVVKTHWDRGSSSRYVVSSACARIRKLIVKLSGQSNVLDVVKQVSEKQ